MKKRTIISELRQEFAVSLERLGSWSKAGFEANPKKVFACMLVLMLGSVLLCFTLLRTAKKKPSAELRVKNKMESGVSEIGETVNRLKRVVEIQAALKVLLAKDSLDSKDSVLMRSMLLEIDGQPVKN